MESIGNWQGQDDVYRRTGYDTRGNANTLFYYARRRSLVELAFQQQEMGRTQRPSGQRHPRE